LVFQRVGVLCFFNTFEKAQFAPNIAFFLVHRDHFILAAGRPVLMSLCASKAIKQTYARRNQFRGHLHFITYHGVVVAGGAAGADGAGTTGGATGGVTVVEFWLVTVGSAVIGQ
jgi:hypothetical protein